MRTITVPVAGTISVPFYAVIAALKLRFTAERRMINLPFVRLGTITLPGWIGLDFSLFSGLRLRYSAAMRCKRSPSVRASASS